MSHATSSRPADPGEGPSPEEVARAVALLEAIADNRELLATIDEDQRRALLIAAGRVSRPTRDDSRRMRKAFRRIENKKKDAHDRELRAGTEIRGARRAEVYVAPAQLVGGETGAEGPEGEGPEAREGERELTKPRNCYVCKVPFRRVHFFYDALCTSCAELNYQKRFQTASLEGKVALITGARIKIGYQAALMMLRAGAHVIVTTRFPRDAAQRYAREEDFSRWGHRLEVHGLDLRHAPSVEIFARYLSQTKDRLDILVNNAAQTVRRPAGFYAHLLALETAALSELPRDARGLLASHERCKDSLAVDGGRLLEASRSHVPGFVGFHGGHGHGPGVGVRESAQLSQLPCAFDDAAEDALVFPEGRLDADLQQVDLRTVNSWRLRLAEVNSAEMLEVQLVNAVAPFILCAKLKPLMTRSPADAKHIVNVSAMEGQFARGTKTDKHPHTNMAKAALNMMTLTSAPDYAKDGIYMNAVDTGWVTDEDPAHLSSRKRADHDFEPPLDIVDGAARICDPFFSGILTGNHVFGQFLKDYAPAEW